MRRPSARGEELFVHLNRLWNDRNGRRRASRAVEPTMPLPMVNMISGGLHAGGNLDIQDVLIDPGRRVELQRGPRDDRRAVSRRRRRPARSGLRSRPWWATRAATGPGSASNEQAFEIVVDAIVGLRLRAGARRRDRRRRGLDPLLRPGPRHLPPACRQATGSSTPPA